MNLSKKLCLIIRDSVGHSTTVKLLAGSREALSLGIISVLDDLEADMLTGYLDKQGIHLGVLWRFDQGKERAEIRLRGVMRGTLASNSPTPHKGELQ